MLKALAFRRRTNAGTLLGKPFVSMLIERCRSTLSAMVLVATLLTAANLFAERATLVAETSIKPEGGGGVSDLEFLPNGQLLVAGKQSFSARGVWVWDAKAGKPLK